MMASVRFIGDLINDNDLEADDYFYLEEDGSDTALVSWTYYRAGYDGNHNSRRS